MQNEQATKGRHEFPKYTGRKEVLAARVEGVHAEEGYLLLLCDPDYVGTSEDAPRVKQDITPEWLERNKPMFGGYYVVHMDGNATYSSCEVFANGYTRTREPTAHAEHILQFFAFQHLPEDLQVVSKSFYTLAHSMVDYLPRNPERTVALRKLLESKDAAVRAALAKPVK